MRRIVVLALCGLFHVEAEKASCLLQRDAKTEHSDLDVAENLQQSPSSSWADSSCAGMTAKGNTNWRRAGSYIYMDIDTSSCGFTATPVYTASLGGNSHHWLAKGGSETYFATKKKFRMYIYRRGGITTANAKRWKWHVNWIAHPKGKQVISTGMSCAGMTVKGDTRWKQASSKGVAVDIDTSSCGFTATPVYTASLGGDSSHWTSSGGAETYWATATGFRMFIYYPWRIGITPEKANRWKWHVNWQARLPGKHVYSGGISCGGMTVEGRTNWAGCGTNCVRLDVDTSSCGFTDTPVYIASLGGDTHHWSSSGGSEPYFATNKKFRIILWRTGVTPQNANRWKWHVNWIARTPGPPARSTTTTVTWTDCGCGQGWCNWGDGDHNGQALSCLCKQFYRGDRCQTRMNDCEAGSLSAGGHTFNFPAMQHDQRLVQDCEFWTGKPNLEGEVTMACNDGAVSLAKGWCLGTYVITPYIIHWKTASWDGHFDVLDNYGQSCDHITSVDECEDALRTLFPPGTDGAPLDYRETAETHQREGIDGRKCIRKMVQTAGQCREGPAPAPPRRRYSPPRRRRYSPPSWDDHHPWDHGEGPVVLEQDDPWDTDYDGPEHCTWTMDGDISGDDISCRSPCTSRQQIKAYQVICKGDNTKLDLESAHMKLGMTLGNPVYKGSCTGKPLDTLLITGHKEDCQAACQSSAFKCDCWTFDNQRYDLPGGGAYWRVESICTLHEGTGIQQGWKYTMHYAGLVSDWQENCGSSTTAELLSYAHQTLVVVVEGLSWELAGTYALLPMESSNGSPTGCHDNRPRYKHESGEWYVLHQHLEKRWVLSSNPNGAPETIVASWSRSKWPWEEPLGAWELDEVSGTVYVGFPPPEVTEFEVRGADCNLGHINGVYRADIFNDEVMAFRAHNSRYVFKHESSDVYLYHDGQCGDWTIGPTLESCWEGENGAGQTVLKGSKGLVTYHSENDPWQFRAGGRGQWWIEGDQQQDAHIHIVMMMDKNDNTPQSLTCNCDTPAARHEDRGGAQNFPPSMVQSLVEDVFEEVQLLQESTKVHLSQALNDYTMMQSTASSMSKYMGVQASNQLMDLAIKAMAVQYSSRSWAQSLPEHVQKIQAEGKNLNKWYDDAEEGFKDALLKLGMYVLSEEMTIPAGNEPHDGQWSVDSLAFEGDRKSITNQLVHEAGIELMATKRTKHHIFEWLLETDVTLCEWKWFVGRRRGHLNEVVKALSDMSHPLVLAWLGAANGNDPNPYSQFAEDAYSDLSNLAKFLACFIDGDSEEDILAQLSGMEAGNTVALVAELETVSEMVHLDLDIEGGFYVDDTEKQKVRQDVSAQTGTARWCGHERDHSQAWCPKTDELWQRTASAIFKTMWCASQGQGWDDCHYPQSAASLMQSASTTNQSSMMQARYLWDTVMVLAKDGATLHLSLNGCKRDFNECIKVKEVPKAIADIILGTHGTISTIFDINKHLWGPSTLIKQHAPDLYTSVKTKAHAMSKMNKFISNAGSAMHSYFKKALVPAIESSDELIETIEVVSRRQKVHQIHLKRVGSELVYQSPTTGKMTKVPVRYNMWTKQTKVFVKGSWVKVGAAAGSKLGSASKMKMLVANLKYAKCTVVLTVVGVAFDLYTFFDTVVYCDDNQKGNECDYVTGSLALVSALGGIITLAVILLGLGPIGLAIGAFLMVGAAVASFLWSVFKPKPVERSRITYWNFFENWCCSANKAGLTEFMRQGYRFSKSQCREYVTDNCGCDWGAAPEPTGDCEGSTCAKMLLLGTSMAVPATQTVSRLLLEAPA